MRIELPFIGPDYAARSPNVNSQKTVNLYPRIQKPGSKTVVALYSTPGLKKVAVAGTGPFRSNGVQFGDLLYFVSGNTLYSVNASGSPVSIGTLATSGGRVEIVSGRSYLALVDGTNGYTYDGTTFAQITDADFPPGPTHITYLDGRFIVNEQDSDRFWVSSIENPTSWGALDFATAEANPDNVLAVAATYKDLYLIGDRTTQVFYNSGNPDFPFDPYPGGTLEIGIQAPHSLAKSSLGLFWLATNAEGDVFVVTVSGFQWQVISDDIAWDLEQFSVTNDAEAFVYRKAGRTFYQISFPTESKTFEYIVEDGFWIERKSNGIDRYLGSGIGYLSNKHFVGDYSSGNLYELDFEVFEDNGTEIERIRRAPVINANDDRFRFDELVIEAESGVGLVTGQGEDPQMMLRWSDDGGHTWSNEHWRSMGKIGEYKFRTRWSRLGMSRERVFEIKVTDPIDVTIVKAYARVTIMRH